MSILKSAGQRARGFILRQGVAQLHRMNWILWMTALALMLLCLLETMKSVSLYPECSHICDIHGPVSQYYCTMEFNGDPLSIRACCLSPNICPPDECPDFGNVSLVDMYYDIVEIALDIEQICECTVVTCVKTEGLVCLPCSPFSKLEKMKEDTKNFLMSKM